MLFLKLKGYTREHKFEFIVIFDWISTRVQFNNLKSIKDNKRVYL